MHPELIDALIALHEATANLQFPMNDYQNARKTYHEGNMTDEAFIALQNAWRAAFTAENEAYALLGQRMEEHDADPELDIYMDWGAEEAKEVAIQIALI